MGKKVLIVEDEKMIVDILVFNLKKEGYETEFALDGEAGLQKAREWDPDLILLDVMLPKLIGFEVCKQLREGGSAVPIIMLTAREEEADKVFGLESGADDYITKPFSMKELMARVKANIRRTAMDQGKPQPGGYMTFDDLRIEENGYRVYKGDTALDLTQKEYDLLKYLAQQPGVVVTREELMEKVWNYDYFGDMRTVDVTVRRLREKIEDDPGHPKYVVTRRGMGYYFGVNS